jgi:isoquinoline 1-oxidoreductase subunit beta
MNDQAYRFPARRIAHEPVEFPIPICPWRSVGHSNNAFAIECFMDEAAAAAGADPLAFRRALLRHSPRHMALLARLETASGWGAPMPKGQGRGIAYHECYGGVGACAVEVEVSRRGELAIRRVVMVADVGVTVNPNLVTQQMEGGAVFGLSAALNGRLTIKGGGVEQSSFADNMPMLLAGCPAMETHIIDSGEAIGGAGELSTPMVVPALVNAIFAATGKRIRRLPLAEADLSWA